MQSKLIPWWQVNFGESTAKLVYKEILNGNVVMGKTTSKLEEVIENILGVKYCVATGSGTSALLMALLASGIEKNDTIAIQDRIWIAPAHAAHILGCKIKVVDVEKNEPRINMDHLKEVLNSKPKALILVHMNGRSNFLPQIVEMCRETGVTLIEDAAQALGSVAGGKFLGTFGDIGCFSLAVSKTISSGQGGFCVTNNEILYRNLKRIRIHGQDDLSNPNWTSFGLNLRYSDILASIALEQLEFLSSRIIEQNKVREFLIEATRKFNFIHFLPMRTNENESGPYNDAKVTNLLSLKNFLLNNGIETKRYYPSITTANYLKIQNRKEILNAHYWYQHGLIFPSGPSLNSPQLDYILEKLAEFEVVLDKGTIC
jgi:dTDP-4-amino-4,6-dideoxygalactose transaminase